jgi:biopolymer transport protein ExbD
MAMLMSTDDDDGGLMVDINTTPLIDVMLVLLIMLIITIPMQTHEVKLDMRTGPPPQSQVAPEIVRITVAADGVISWNGQPVADSQSLETHMSEAAAAPVQPELHLRPDPQAPYRQVAMVLASAQRRGLTKIGIVGNAQTEEGQP